MHKNSFSLFKFVTWQAEITSIIFYLVLPVISQNPEQSLKKNISKFVRLKFLEFLQMYRIVLTGLAGTKIQYLSYMSMCSQNIF